MTATWIAAATRNTASRDCQREESRARDAARRFSAPTTAQRLREAQLLTKAELARGAGISPLTVSRIESALDCRVDPKRKIILALGLTPSDRRKVFGSGRARARVA